FADHVGDRDADARLRKTEHVIAVAADSRYGQPPGGELTSVDCGQRPRQKGTLYALGLLALPCHARALRSIGLPFRNLAAYDLDKRRVVPRLLHEALRAFPHRLDG